MVRYGQRNPPAYDFSLIHSHIKIYHAPHDRFYTESAVERLVRNLPNAKVTCKKMDEWGHMSFCFGREMRQFYTQIFNESIKI